MFKQIIVLGKFESKMCKFSCFRLQIEWIYCLEKSQETLKHQTGKMNFRETCVYRFIGGFFQTTNNLLINF